MSIESALAKLTAAVEANTEALLSGGGQKASSGKTSTTTTKRKTTVDEVAKKFSAYLAADGDEATTNVRSILKKFGAKRVTEINEDNFDEALEMLAACKAGENPLGGDDDDLM